MQPAAVQYLSMLFGQAPLLIVYLSAVIVSVMFWSRHPRPALFVFLGSLLLLLTTLAWPLLQTWMLDQRAAGGMTTTQLGQRIAVVSLVMSVVRAAAFGLLVYAAFVGRQRVEAGFPMASAAPSSPPPLRL